MARLRVRILSRYLLREHVPPLVFGLATLTALMLINQIAKRFADLVGKGLPWTVIAEVFVLSLPFIIAMTLPMAVLVAVLYTFSRIAADHELTAMKAGGVSLGRLMVPVLLGGAAVAVVAFAWSDQLLPRSNHELRTLLVDIQRKKPSFSLREQVINEVLPGQFFLRATRIDPATNKLKNVTIYDLEDADRRRIINADSGRMAYTPGGKDLYLTLEHGDIQEVQRSQPAQFNRTFFVVNRIKVADVGNTLERTDADNDTYRGDREMGVCAMEQVVASEQRAADAAAAAARAHVVGDLRRLAGLTQPPPPPSPAAVAADSPEVGPARGLYCKAWRAVAALVVPRPAAAQGRPPQKPPLARPLPGPLRVPFIQVQAGPPPTSTLALITQGATIADEQQRRAALQRAADYEVEIQKKYAIAASCIIFVLVGVPTALRFPRGGVGLVIGMSMIVFTVYYVGLIGGEELGKRMSVTPFFSMWTPNLIFGVAGLVGLWLTRREGRSPR